MPESELRVYEVEDIACKIVRFHRLSSPASSTKKSVRIQRSFEKARVPSMHVSHLKVASAYMREEKGNRQDSEGCDEENGKEPPWHAEFP
jgi:hypothetical protein